MLTHPFTRATMPAQNVIEYTKDIKDFKIEWFHTSILVWRQNSEKIISKVIIAKH